MSLLYSKRRLIWTIAQKLPNISVEDLKKWNDISSKDLKPGMAQLTK